MHHVIFEMSTKFFRVFVLTVNNLQALISKQNLEILEDFQEFIFSTYRVER